MKIPIYEKYKNNFSEKIGDLFKNVEKLEEEIRNIKIETGFSLDSKESALYELNREIIKYFQFNNGSLGFDIFLIKYVLYQMLIFTHIVKEIKLSKEEKNTCLLEINVRFYFFLNSIYNLKEKLEKFFNIDENNNSFKKDTILLENGKNHIIKIFIKFYKEIKKYCDARCDLVHDTYVINYDPAKNEINISTSKFDLSDKNIVGRGKKKYTFSLNDKELINLIEEIQETRKKIINFFLNIESLINLEKLVSKFKDKNGVYNF